VEHAILLANADIRASGVEVKRELTHDMPLLMVDRRRLLQALLNTIRNGAQAMPEGGVLAVATRVRRVDGDVLRLEIEISDSGMGIPTRALKQVFDPFFSTKIRGSGLGLAVTLRIIRDHGGDIDVYSEEGQGTTFVMCLPLQLASSNDAAAENSKLPKTRSAARHRVVKLFPHCTNQIRRGLLVESSGAVLIRAARPLSA
jgi:signal transduction histidine kinase